MGMIKQTLVTENTHLLTRPLSIATAIVISLAATTVSAQKSTDTELLTIDEIVVTARKRTESLQETPIAITAFTGDGLAARGIDRADDLANFTPNLTFQNSPGHSASSNAAVYIRGVGQQDFVPTVEPGVGIYVDGIYVARSLGAVLDIVDVERIEVLRGPQGTLFGRNTIGGAIHVITKKPDNEFGGSLEAKVGIDSRQDIRASINVPFTQNLAGSLSIASLNQDGYVERDDGIDLGDDDTLTGRLKLRWDASENFSVDFGYDFTRDRENGPAFVLHDIGTDSIFYNPVDADGNFDPAQIGNQIATQGINSLTPVDNFALLHNFVQAVVLPQFGNTAGADCLTQIPGQPFDGGGNVDNPLCYNSQFVNGNNRDSGTAAAISETDLDGFSLSAEWAVNDSLTIKSITGYREIEGTFARDGDHSPLPVVSLTDSYEQEQLTQEFQFLGEAMNDRLNWILGLYYFEEEGTNVNDVFFPPADVRSGGSFENNSQAIFAQGTYDLTEALALTIGLRYTEDEKNFAPDQFILADRTMVDTDNDNIPDSPAFGVGTRVLPFIEETVDISETTPMVNLSYQWSDDLLVYGTYAEGFKGGGFTQRVFPPLAIVPSFLPEFVEVYELGFKYTGVDGRMRLNGAIFYSDYDDVQVSIFDPSSGNTAPIFENAAKASLQGAELELIYIPVADWQIEANVGWIDPSFDEVDQTANEITTNSEFERISEWTGSAGLSKDSDIGDSGDLRVRADITYRSEYFNDALNDPGIAQNSSVTQINLNLTWISAEQTWEVSAGGTNITDKEFVVSGLNNTTFDIQERIYSRGREWYLSAKYNF